MTIQDFIFQVNGKFNIVIPPTVVDPNYDAEKARYDQKRAICNSRFD